MTEHFITLSTTQLNNYLGLPKMRQGDTNTQDIETIMPASGKLSQFDCLSVFFNDVLHNRTAI